MTPEQRELPQMWSCELPLIRSGSAEQQRRYLPGLEYELERDLRDAVGSRIDSGTSEIQKNIIAAHLRL